MHRFNTPLLALALLAGSATPPASASAADDNATATATVALPLVTVHKSPYCGCCTQWVEHLRAHGFEVRVVDTADMTPVKRRVGVPAGKVSCHTAEVGGYFVEGHVPAGDVRRLLTERPEIRGLVLAGMPPGSPGMETPDGSVPPYVVEQVGNDGSLSDYARHGN